MSALRLAVLGTGVFIASLLALWPASRLLATLQSPSSAWRLFGVEGSLVRGRVDGLARAGQPLLQNLEWRFAPWQLLRLNLGARLSAAPAHTSSDERLDALLRVSPLGRWTLEDLRGDISLRAIAAAAGQTYIPLEGRLQADIESLSWSDEGLPKAQGVLRLNDLRWALAQTPLPLGDFEVRIEPRDDSVEAKIASGSGALEVSGEATLDGQKNYELHLQLRGAAGADAGIQNLLRAVGPADNQGWHHLRRNGKL